MARSNLRLAAGGCVVAAFLLIGDPTGAVAFADGGGSGSQSSHAGSGKSSGHGGNRDKRQGQKQGADNNRASGTADRVRNSLRSLTREVSTPRTTIGSDRFVTEIDTELVNQVDRVLSTENLVIGALDVPEFGTVDQSDSSAPSGAEQSRAPTVPSWRPCVTVGNGRSPVVLNDQPAEPQGDGGAGAVPVAAPVGPPATEAVTAPRGRSWVERLSLPHVGASLPSQPTNPILGLTGLLMISAVGAFLGYRQARATQRTGALARQ